MPNLDLSIFNFDTSTESDSKSVNNQRRSSLNNLNQLLSDQTNNSIPIRKRKSFSSPPTTNSSSSSISFKASDLKPNSPLNLLQILSTSSPQRSTARTAQLNLLAQQARLASVGSTNAQSAKAANLVLGHAVVAASANAEDVKRRQSMGQFNKSTHQLQLERSQLGGIGDSAVSSDSEDEEEVASKSRLNQKKQRMGHSNSFSGFGSFNDGIGMMGTRVEKRKMTDLYAKQLADTFSGESFLDAAGEVAKDYARFYRAEREWTGRALRRQSREDEEKERRLSQSQSQRGSVDKGKKRELEPSNTLSPIGKRQRNMFTSNSSPEFRIKNNHTSTSEILNNLESSRKSISQTTGSNQTSPVLTSMEPPSSLPPSSNNVVNRTRSNSRISPLSSRNTSPIPSSKSPSLTNLKMPMISITPASNSPTSPIPNSNNPSTKRSQSLTSFGTPLTFGSSLAGLAHRASLGCGDRSSSSLISSNSSTFFQSNPFPNNGGKLTSVLSNFASLLESREQGCEGLQSLANQAKSLTQLPNFDDVLKEKKLDRLKDEEVRRNSLEEERRNCRVGFQEEMEIEEVSEEGDSSMSY